MHNCLICELLLSPSEIVDTIMVSVWPSSIISQKRDDKANELNININSNYTESKEISV